MTSVEHGPFPRIGNGTYAGARFRNFPAHLPLHLCSRALRNNLALLTEWLWKVVTTWFFSTEKQLGALGSQDLTESAANTQGDDHDRIFHRCDGHQ